MSGRLIFHVSAEFQDQSWGGISSALDLMTEASASCGDEVWVLTCSNSSKREVLANGVCWEAIGSLTHDEYLLYHSAQRVERGAEFSAIAAKRILEIAGSRSALLCIHNEELLGTAELLRDSLEVSVVLFSHGLASQEHPDTPQLFELQRRYLESGFAVVVHSRAQLEIVYKNAEYCRVKYLPLPLALLPSEGPRRRLDQIDSDLVVAAGRAVPQKGFDLLEEAFAVGEIPRRLRCEVFCRRSNEDEVISSKNGQVKFVRWKRRTELMQVFKRARCVVVPSRFEPLGLVAAEALVCGVPVIYSEVGGLAELVSSGDQLGVGFRIGNGVEASENLRSAILAELARPVRITSGKTYVDRSYSVERFRECLEDVAKYSEGIT